MSQPRAYTQTTNFNDHSTIAPNDPHSGANLDTEFAEIKQNTDDLNTNIALLQRDDGKLNNEAVHKDAFDQDSLALIGLSGYNVRGTWAAATAYASGDIITNNDATYLTTTAHTSSPAFSTDSANWTLLANAAINVTGHSVDTLNGVGAGTLQGASFSSGGTAVTHTGNSATGTALAVGQYLSHSSFPVGTKVASITDTNNFVTDTAATAAGSSQVINRGLIFPLTYQYSDTTAFQVYVANQLTAPSLYSVSTVGSTTYLIFNTAPAAGTGNIIVWGGGVAVENTKAQVTSYRDDTLDHRDTTIDYATRTGAVVRLFDGASNNVSDTSPANQAGVYSAKEHAEGVFVPEGSAKSWATKDTTAVASSLFSAKEYASGSSATGGTAKQWASDTSAAVDTDFSSKEYAQGTQASTGGSAKDYAQKTDGGVSGATSDHSAKAWAVGGTGVTDTASKGAAKEWAIKAEDSTVDGTNFSALHWANKAATTYDNFDDRFLGGHTTAEREVGASNIGKDHDGNALVSGALYFDTTLGVMKVWDGTSSTWKQLTPTTAEQTNIDTIVTGKDGTASTSGTTLNMALINTTVANLADVNNFANRYRTGASDPTTSKDDGDLFWNTTTDELKIYDATSSSWVVPYLDSYSVDTVANNAAVAMSIALG